MAKTPTKRDLRRLRRRLCLFQQAAVRRAAAAAVHHHRAPAPRCYGYTGFVRGSNGLPTVLLPATDGSEQRQQFGRLIYAGYSREQIKRLMPRCSRCVSELLGAAGKPQGRPRLARLRG